MIENGDIEAVKLLDEEELTYRDDVMNSLLHIAANNGKFEIVKILYDKGLSLYTCNEAGYLPIHSAAKNGYANIVEWFISTDPDQINQVSDSGYTPLHLAAKNSQIEVMKTLIINNADYTISDNYYRSPIRLLLNEHPDYEQYIPQDNFFESLVSSEQLLDFLGKISK